VKSVRPGESYFRAQDCGRAGDGVHAIVAGFAFARASVFARDRLAHLAEAPIARTVDTDALRLDAQAKIDAYAQFLHRGQLARR
jgi:hypothetical protein